MRDMPVGGKLSQYVWCNGLNMVDVTDHLRTKKGLDITMQRVWRYCDSVSPFYGKPEIWKLIWETMDELGVGNKQDLEELVFAPSELEKLKSVSGKE